METNLLTARRLLVAVALLTACTRAGSTAPGTAPDTGFALERDAPERRAAAERTLRESAGHAVTIDVDAALGPENRTDLAIARLDEALAGAIDRQNPRGADSCAPTSQCRASYRAANEADTLGLARGLTRFRIVYMAPAKRDEPRFDPASGTLTYPFPPDASIDNVDARDAIHAVIYDTLRAVFAGRKGQGVRDSELPRYVLLLAEQDCAVDALAAVYDRLNGATQELARELLSTLVTSARCGQDDRSRRLWTAWYVAHSRELDEEQLRAASSAVFPPASSGIIDVPAPAELPDLRALPYAIAVLKRALRDPSTKEAKVLACVAGDYCNSPLYAYFTSSPNESRSAELARALVAEHSPELTALVVRHLLANRTRDMNLFLDQLTADAAVWTAALTESLRLNNYGASDMLSDIWARHPPLRAALLRAADAASQSTAPDTQRRSVINAVTRLALGLCRSDPQTRFFALLDANVPRASPLYAEVAKGGTSCAVVDKR